MRMLFQLTPILVFLLLPFAAPECVLTPDPENVLSTQLEGSWVLDVELTERLDPEYGYKMSNVTFKFENSPEVVDMIPEEECEWFGNYFEGTIYMAGFFSGRENEESWHIFPMVLTTLSGNPHIMYWRFNWTASDSFNVMLARSSDRSQDMLFTGGDFNDTPMNAWKRL